MWLVCSDLFSLNSFMCLQRKVFITGLITGLQIGLVYLKYMDNLFT